MRLVNFLRKIISSQKSFLKGNDVKGRMPTMQDSLKVLLECGVEVNTVLDVGILTGTQPLMEVFPDIKHHLFEPVDLHFKTISNNYRNISHELHHVALSNEDGSVFLACKSIHNDGKITHSEVVPDEVSDKDVPGLISCKEIKRARLDSITKDARIEPPYLLKIDVDGHEMPILEGALQTLKDSTIVVIEAPLNKVALPHFFERSKFLMDNGFYLVDIVDLAYYDGMLWQADLVFVRKSVADNIDRLRPFESDSFAFEREKWKPLSNEL